MVKKKLTLKQKSEQIKKQRLAKLKELKRKNNNQIIYSFLKLLIEDKFYLFSFLVTLAFLSVLYFDKITKDDVISSNNKVVDEAVLPSVSPGTDIGDVSTSLNISDYVGIYSRNVELSSPLKINTCDISSYKIVYQIKMTKEINKYLVNDCLGNIKIWSDTLDYKSSGGARYIGANNTNFIFGTNSLKEVDSDTYKIDDSINSIREKVINSNINTYFYGNDIVLMGLDNLALIKGSLVSYQLKDNFNNNGGKIEKRVYNGSNKYTFDFFVFENGEEMNCYDNNISDDVVYHIYSIKYNVDTGLFDEPKELYVRTKKDGCSVYNDDLANLKD